MGRNEKTRQPREGAVTGSVGKPCVLAGSPDHPTTAGVAEHGPSRPAAVIADATDPSVAEARILVGVTSWLAAARDWFGAEAEHARDEHDLEVGESAVGATVTLRLADVETFARGLANAVGHLDRLTVDRASVDALAVAVPPASPDRRRLQ